MPDASAYHGAGHAFVAIYLGARVKSVTIEPDWDDGPGRYGVAQVEWRLGEVTDRQQTTDRIDAGPLFSAPLPMDWQWAYPFRGVIS